MATSKCVEISSKTVHPSNMKVGQYAVLRACKGLEHLIGSIVVASYTSRGIVNVVSLTQPGTNWIFQYVMEGNDFQVELLPSGSKVEITV